MNHYAGVGGLFSMTLAGVTYLGLALDQEKTAWARRNLVLCLYGLSQGMSLGPMVRLFTTYHNSTLFIVVFCLAAMFVCFTGCALLAKQRDHLYIGSLVSTAIILLTFLNIMSALLPHLQDNMYHLIGWILAFGCFLVADSQLIIEKVNNGNRDFAGHAIELFLDLFAVFYKVGVALVNQILLRVEPEFSLPYRKSSDMTVVDNNV